MQHRPQHRSVGTVILEERPHPEQGYRSCLGILRLAKKYSEDRLEAACGKLLAVRARSYRHVEGVLKNDRVESDLPESRPPVDHDNIRGGEDDH